MTLLCRVDMLRSCQVLRLYLVALLFPVVAAGHSVYQVFADGKLSPEHVTLTYEVGILDVAYAVDKESVLTDVMDGVLLRQGVELTRLHLRDGMRVILPGEEIAPVRYIGETVPEIPDGPIALAAYKDTNFAFTVDYAIGNKPESLRFQHAYQNADFVIPVSVVFALGMQGRMDLAPVTFLVGDDRVEASRAVFDWADHAQEPIRVTSAAEPINAYLYIHPHEVRVEMLMSLATLETWIPIPREDHTRLEVAEQETMRESLEGFFAFQNQVNINSIPADFRVSRMGFFAADASDFLTQTEVRPLQTRNAYFGVVLVSAVNDLPQQLDLTWTMFNDQVGMTRGVVFLRNQSLPFECTRDAPVYIWKNPGNLAIPKVLAVNVRQRNPGSAEQEELISTLLGNVYQSFEYHSESDIYDALDRAVDGDLLAALYLQIKQSLIMQEQGGAIARVRDVSVTDIRPLEPALPDGFVNRVTWRVDGTVEHWGHIHARVNEYAADIGVVRAGGVWKIRALQVVSQKQISVGTTVRTL